VYHVTIDVKAGKVHILRQQRTAPPPMIDSVDDEFWAGSDKDYDFRGSDSDED
jgi:hypothetical protein